MKSFLNRILSSNVKSIIIFMAMLISVVDLVLGSAIDPLHGIRWIADPLAEYVVKESAMPLFIVFFQIIKYDVMIGLGYLTVQSYKRIRGVK